MNYLIVLAGVALGLACGFFLGIAYADQHRIDELIENRDIEFSNDGKRAFWKRKDGK